MVDINLSGLGGMDRLIAGLNASSTDVTPKVSEAVRDSTRRGTQVAKREAPVDTGHLVSLIDGVSTALSGAITSHASYSGFVNGGTSRQAPNEYMGRTARIIEPEFAQAVIEAAKPNL